MENSDRILKAWKAMDDAVKAMREAKSACCRAAGAIKAIGSEAAPELAGAWADRADRLNNLIWNAVGQPK